MASDKLWCSQEFSEAGLPQLKTVFADMPRHVEFLIKQVGDLPAVEKLPRGSQGKQVFIMEIPQSANTTLQTFFSIGQPVILQEYIETGAKDIRAIVVGNKVVSVMEHSGKKDFRANLSQGGAGRDVLNELTDKEKELCIKAAQAVKLDFVGVDFVRDYKGNALFIEANGNPGEKIINVTGRNHYGALLDLIVEKVGKSSPPSAPKVTSAEASTQSGSMMEAIVAKAKKGVMLTLTESAIFAIHQRNGK